MSKGIRYTASLFVALLLALFVGVKVIGCWDKIEYPDHEPVVKGGPTDADQAQLALVNEFSFRLAHELELDDNTLVSPLSLYQNLALLLNGAEGETKTALDDVLGLTDVARQDLNDSHNRLINRYREMDGRPVRLANGIFFVWPIVLSKGIVQKYEQWYNADIVKLGSAGVGAVREINLWADEQTDGMISEVVQSLDKEQIMLVLNALALDAKWESPFLESATSDSVFHTPAGDFQIPTMMRSGSVETQFSEIYTALRLRFAGGELAMTIVMPDESMTPSGWLREFDSSTWSSFNDDWMESERNIYLPKFSLHDQVDLVPAVKALGGDSLFNSPNDFRHFSSDLVGLRAIAKIEQFTFMDVDELGTRAAVSDTEVSASSLPPGDEIHIDRPFAFFIHDLKTDVILFFGVVNEPTL